MGCCPSCCLEAFKSKETFYLEKIVKHMETGKLQPLDHSALVLVRDKDDLLAEANTMFRLHKLKEAKELFQEIITKGLFEAEKIVGLGSSEEQVGHYEHNPVQWYFQNQVKTSNPYDPLFFCYSITKDFQLAKKWIQKELSIHPEDYRLMLGLAHVHYNLKQYKQARQLYLKVVNLKKQMDRPYFLIASIYRKQNKQQQAKQWAEKALQYNPENYYTHFMIALCEKDNLQRIVRLKQAKKINRSYGRPYNALGNAYKRGGDIDKAISSYKKCIDLAPNYQAPYIGLGNIYRENKMYNTAIEYYLKSIKINPQMDIALVALGNTYNEIQNFQKTMYYYQQAIILNKECYAAYYGLGVVLKKTDKLIEAQQNFEKALQFCPDYSLALQGLADLELSLGNFQKTKSLCTKLIEMNVIKGNIYYLLGQASYKLEDLDSARLNYEKCFKIQPNFLENLCGLGNIHYKLEEYGIAESYFNKCLSIDKNYQWAFYYLGKLYKKLGQLKESEEFFTKCLKINEKNRYALNALGKLLCVQDRVSESIKFYQKSIECQQSSFSSHYGLGNSLFMSMNYDEAINAYKIASQLDPQNYQPYNGLGNCFKSLMQYDEALKCYQHAIELNPANDVSFYGIANILNLQGNLKEAEQYFVKALERNETSTLCKMNLGFVYLKMENFKKAFQLICSARDSINQDDRLTQGNRQYLKDNIKIFEEQAEQWQVRSKMGFITESSKAHLNKIIDNFEDKVKFLYKSEEEGSKINKKVVLNPQIITIVNLLYNQKFKLTQIKPIFHEIHKLFFVDEDYFHILPQIFCQYFWGEKFLRNRSTADIERYLTQLIKTLAGEVNNNSKGGLQNTQIDQCNEQIKLSVFQNKREKVNLFKDTDYFLSYQQLYSQIKAANTKAIQFLPEFQNLVTYAKKNSKGFNEKVNLKLAQNSKNEFKVMLRIMQKMFREIRSKKNQLIQTIDTILDQMDNVTIDLVVHEIIGVWTNQINMILQKRIAKKKPTPCYISDLVRGKMFFNKVDHIKGAIGKIEEYCQKNKYHILDCENRLLKPQTRDVVLKIYIGQAVCELQLAIKQNLVDYHFDHCLYEILRSPLGCIFGSYLFMSKGFKYPFIQNCKDIREHLKKKSSLKDRVIARKIEYIIKTLERQQIPFKSTKIKRTKSEEHLELHLSSPVRQKVIRQKTKCNEV